MERDGEYCEPDDEWTDVTDEDSDYPREEDTDYGSDNEEKTTTAASLPSSRALIVTPPCQHEQTHAEQKMEYSVDQSEENDEVPESMKCVLCLQLLLDPASLSCGHTFCQVCLVRMKTSRPFSLSPNNHCPMCRKPWVDVPAVNISFRDTLEQTYPQKIAQRKAQLTPEEKKALADYSNQKQTRTTGSTTYRVAGQANPQHVLIILACMCVAVVIFLAVALSVIFLVFGGAGGGYVNKPVSHWSAEDVMEWMSGLGETIQQDCKEVFHRERIDGPHLLLMTNETLVGLNISRQFTIDSLLVSIDRLKENDYVHPTSFVEFKAAYPVQTVMLTLSFTTSPRCTFLYLYLFQYYKMFLPIVHPFQSTAPTDDELEVEQDTSWLKLLTVMFEVIVVPHVAISIFALGWIWVHPALCCLVWLHCFTSFKSEINVYYSRYRHVTLTWLLRETFWYVILFAILWAIMSVVLSVFPMFLLNLLFYLALAYAVYGSLFQSVVFPVVQYVINTIRRARRVH